MLFTLQRSKALLLVSAFSLCLACSEDGPAQKAAGGGGTEDGQEEEVPETGPTLPENLTLVAKKEYGPSRWTDGVWDETVDLGADVQFLVTVPGEIPVTSGNAGNHQMTVKFDKDSTNVICTYKGGADVSKPIRSGNQRQIEKGLKYHLMNCSDGSEAGDPVTVDQTVHVSIGNGDSTETTEVTVELVVTPI